jgi:hypothetical protein
MNRVHLVLILSILGVLFASVDLRAQNVSQDPNSLADGDAKIILPGSFFDMMEPAAAAVDYSPPKPPSYDLPLRKLDLNGLESSGGESSAKKATQTDSIGRIQNNGGSMGLETDRRLDPNKIGPHNDFVENQSKNPDSFIGFSIVSPYDSK